VINLTVAINTVDSDGDPITNITDWMVDGTSIAVVNLPFDSNVSSLSAYGVKDYSTYSNDVRLGTGISGYAPVWNDAVWLEVVMILMDMTIELR